MIQSLTDAAAQNDIDAAKNLLRQKPKPDVNKKADAGVYHGFTSFMIAAGLGNPPMVKLLLDMERMSSSWTAVWERPLCTKLRKTKT